MNSILLPATAFLVVALTTATMVVASSVSPTSAGAYEFLGVYGSCNDHHKNQSYWNIVHRTAINARQHPDRNENIDMLLWLGDIVYHDKTIWMPFELWPIIPFFHSYRVSLDEMQQNWDTMKNGKEYQNFLHYTKSVIGTYDDHDLGFNDAGKEWPDMKESQKMLLDFLGVPPSNSPQATAADKVRRDTRHGVYAFHKFALAPTTTTATESSNKHNKKKAPLQVCFVNLDARSNRDRPQGDGGGDMLGEPQWQWLGHVLRYGADPDFVDNNNNNNNMKNDVKNIDDVCAVTFITSGVQVLGDTRVLEGWGEFPQSRDRLLRTLVKSGAHRFVILTGDTHFAEVNVLRALPFKNQHGGNEKCGESPFRHLGQDLYDITSSGFTEPNLELMFPNHRQTSGPDYQTPNFGVVKVLCTDPFSAKSCNVQVTIHDAFTGQKVLSVHPKFYDLTPPPEFLQNDVKNCPSPEKYPERYTLPTYFAWATKIVMLVKEHVPGLFYACRLDVLFLVFWSAVVVLLMQGYIAYKLTVSTTRRMKAKGD